MGNLSTLWCKSLDELIIKLGKYICNSGYSISLRVYEAQSTCNLKAMLLENPVNLSKLTLSKAICTERIPIYKCSEELVERSSLLTYKREVKIHRVVSILLDYGHQRITILVILNGSL